MLRKSVFATAVYLASQLFFVDLAFGLGFEAFGPAEHVGASSDWPKGVEPLLKHGSRVYFRDVNGYGISYYNADIEQVNELIKLFSQTNLKRHIVLLRLGLGETKSFQGKPIAYTVKFDQPAGLFLFHARQHAQTGLYSTEPSLVVHIDEASVDRLKDLVIPDTVEIFRSQYDSEQLLNLAKDKSADLNTRCRALEFIGEAAFDTPDIRAVLSACTLEADQYIQRNANNALAALDSRKEIDASVAKEFEKYLTEHPRLHKVPTPAEMLKQLKAIDKKYLTAGFTARGTLVNHEGNLMNWTVTMGNDRLLIQETAADDKAIGRIEHTIFVSPDDMLTIQKSQYWVGGKLIQSKPFKSVEPVGNTYDILIGRMLWPIGRSFCRRIDRVESVAENPDGTLKIVAIGENDLGIRWELTVDPFADHLITSAKGYRVRQGEVESDAEYIVKAAGVVGNNDRFTNHTAHWQEGEKAQPRSMAVTAVSSKPDLNLMIDFEEQIKDGSK